MRLPRPPLCVACLTATLLVAFFPVAVLSPAADDPPDRAPFDVVIRGGDVYDGSGKAPRKADVGIRSDKIDTVGDLSKTDPTVALYPTALAAAPPSTTTPPC